MPLGYTAEGKLAMLSEAEFAERYGMPAAVYAKIVPEEELGLHGMQLVPGGEAPPILSEAGHYGKGFWELPLGWSTEAITKWMEKKGVTEVDMAIPTGTVNPGDSPSGNGVKEALTTAQISALLSKGGQWGMIAAAAYATLKVVGMVFPWESAEGEGLIAPWTPKMRDEAGKWVSAITRPDLFGGEAPLGSISGVKVVKSWKAGGWPFSLTSDGRIHTLTKNGIQKSWKPKKPVVLVPGSLSLKTYVRASKILDRQTRVIARRVKGLKLA